MHAAQAEETRPIKEMEIDMKNLEQKIRQIVINGFAVGKIANIKDIEQVTAQTMALLETHIKDSKPEDKEIKNRFGQHIEAEAHNQALKDYQANLLGEDK
jgi:hypothetical protein